MDDREIRTYLGQENPTSDAFGAQASELNIMRDKSAFHTGYSNANKEYTVMKK